MMPDSDYVLKAGDTMTGPLEFRFPGPRNAITVYDHNVQVVGGHIQSIGYPDEPGRGGGFEARDAHFMATRGDFFIGGGELGHGFGFGLRGEQGGMYRNEEGITLRTDTVHRYLLIEDNDGTHRRIVLDNETGVRKHGDVMTGSLLLHGDPELELEAVPKRYADGFLPLASGTLTGDLTIATPVWPGIEFTSVTHGLSLFIGEDNGGRFVVAGHTGGFQGVVFSVSPTTGTAWVQSDPETDGDVATKRYVDNAIAAAMRRFGKS